MTEEIRKQIKERGIDEYIIRWRLRKNEREETKRSQRENVPTEIWKSVEKFIEETTLYEVMTWYRNDLKIRGKFKELIDKLESWNIDVDTVISEWEKAISKVVRDEAYKRFKVLNKIQLEAIQERIKLLQKVWEELIKAMYKFQIVELYEKIEKNEKLIWKSSKQIEFVENYFEEMFYKIKRGLLSSEKVKLNRKN